MTTAFSFGRFELRPASHELLEDGRPVALGARAFGVLQALIEHRERTVTKDELLDRAWPGVVVEENNLQVQISTLRKLLGPQSIATIPGRGYRFAAVLDIPPASATPIAPAAKPRTNLPRPLPALLGRESDVASLGALIDQHLLVSVVGAGGMGKTLLAQHVLDARRETYAHGVCWVEFAHINDPALIPTTVAAALGVDLGVGDPLQGLCTAVGPLDMLIALDNAEHFLGDVAAVAKALLTAAPDVRLLVTTQAPLKLPAEWVYRIGPLAVPNGLLPAAQALDFSAVALFVERARAVDARFVLTDAMAPTVIELCRQLDGLPLAIEFAAARAPMLGVQQLAHSMQDRLKLLNTGRNRNAPARQQTLRAALEWSHGFLDEREQTVFRRLAVFVGSASLEAIKRVVPDPKGDLDEWAVLDALVLLVERSLVVVITPDDAVEPRYRLLDTPRMFALEKLGEAAEEAPLRQRHGHALAAYFFEAQGVMDSGTVRFDHWRHAMAADVDNGREALRWTRSVDDAVRIVQIATAIARALPHSAYRERVALAYEVEPLVERIDDADLLALLCWIFSAASGIQPHRALTFIRRCVIRLPSEGASDTPAVRFARYSSLCALAQAEVHGGELSAAETALAAARELVDPTWPPIRQRKIVFAEGVVAGARGDAFAGRRWARQRVALDDAIGDSDVTGRINLMDAELAAGDATSATAAGVALLADLTGGRDEHALAYCRLIMGAGYLVLGDREQARLYLRAGWVQAALFDLEGMFANYLALLAALDGRHEAAARLAGHADASNAHLKREPNEAAAITRAAQLARAGLGDTIFDRLHAEGCSLRGSDIEALAFGPASHGMVHR